MTTFCSSECFLHWTKPSESIESEKYWKSPLSETAFSKACRPSALAIPASCMRTSGTAESTLALEAYLLLLIGGPPSTSSLVGGGEDGGCCVCLWNRTEASSPWSYLTRCMMLCTNLSWFGDMKSGGTICALVKKGKQYINVFLGEAGRYFLLGPWEKSMCWDSLVQFVEDFMLPNTSRDAHQW